MSDADMHPYVAGAAPSLPLERARPLDPPDELARLRASSPLSRLSYPDGHVGWLVTSYSLARAVLTDNRFSGAMEARRLPIRFPAGESINGHPAPPGVFVGLDPPEHTRYRRLLNREFTAGAIERLQPAIEASVAEHLDAMHAAGPPADLVRSFALPIPSLAICALLGVPYADHEKFQQLSEVGMSFESTKEEATAARARLTEYLGDLVKQKRARPGDDLLSMLAATDEVTHAEATGVGTLLLSAGFETTANMLSLGVLTLLSAPDQLEALKRDPALMDNTVEELLRYLTIVHCDVTRTALVDVELEGGLVRAGETVTVSLPAANRDPARFDDPEHFDVTRSAKGHLAFVHGIHACIGQHLARLEMHICFRELFQRFPSLRLAAAPEELEFGGLLYGVKRLPVAW